MKAKHFRVINANDIVAAIPQPQLGMDYAAVGDPVTLSHPKSQYAIYRDPSYCLRFRNWLGSCLESFWGIGTFYKDLSKISPPRRSSSDEIQNILMSGVTAYNDDAPARLHTNAVGATLQMSSWLIFFILDHFPSEYIQHIKELPSRSF